MSIVLLCYVVDRISMSPTPDGRQQHWTGMLKKL